MSECPLGLGQERVPLNIHPAPVQCRPLLGCDPLPALGCLPSPPLFQAARHPLLLFPHTALWSPGLAVLPGGLELGLSSYPSSIASLV